MMARLAVVTSLLVGVGVATVALAAGPHPALNRPDVFEVGEPMLISRETLKKEMGRNTDMAAYIKTYGWPDLAEVQEVTVDPPLAAYEVRLYYVRRDHMLAFSPVHVSAALEDFGLRKYDGPIPPQTLARLIAAAPPSAPAPAVVPPPPPAARVAPEPAPVAEPVAERQEAVAAEPQPVAEEVGSAGETDELEARLSQMEAAADRAVTAADDAERSGLAAQASADRAASVVAGLGH